MNEGKSKVAGTPGRREPNLDRFAFLWAFAILAHQVGYKVVWASSLDAALMLSALAVMVLPGLSLLLGFLAALHIATVLVHLPDVFNHWYFAALVSFSVLLACAAAWWQARRAGGLPIREGLPIAFAPAARWGLLLLYFLSGFHKLNADFFDPAVSCAVELSQTLATRLGGLPNPPAMAPLVIGLVVAVELALPALLLIPRLRRIGVGVGVLFHLAMALAGYWRFSAAGLALLTLFLPAGMLTWRPGLRLAAVALLLPGVPLASQGGDALFFGAVVALSLAMLWLAVARKWPAPEGRILLPERITSAALIGSAAVLLSGVTPYLGLGTDRAFSMYSNLRTEGGRSNHFLIPASLQPYSHQRDLVQVIESSATGLESLADRGLLIPFAELRARLTEEISRSDSLVSLSYLRQGTRHDVSSASSDSTLDLPVSSLRIKFLRFRPVEGQGSRHCGV